MKTKINIKKACKEIVIRVKNGEFDYDDSIKSHLLEIKEKLINCDVITGNDIAVLKLNGIV